MTQSETNGFVKLDRGILNWEWYSEPCTRGLFIHCILKANWKAGSWKGQPYERGQFITSLSSLADETGYSVQNIKTALKHLISTGELTSKATNKYRIITVCNYDKYQVTNKPDNKVLTNNQQTANKQLTTDEEYKEIKNKRSNNIYASSFEEVWKIYPKKKEKSASYKAYQNRINDGFTEEELLKATKAYVAECEKTGQWVKTAKTFFGSNTPFVDYLKAGEENAVQETEAEREQRQADEFNRKYS